MEKQKLLILQGVPASGKTTFAEEFIKSNPGWIRVNRDEIRSNMSDKWSREQETHVTDIEDFIVTSSLGYNKSVIVDDTNLNQKTIEHWKEIASMYEVDIEFKFFEVSFREAIDRDSKRQHKVGYNTIYNFFNKYFPDKIKDHRYMEPFTKETNCIICDLDGTLALNTGRGWFEYDKVHTDDVDWRLASILNMLEKSGNRIFFITGRDEECQDETCKWIEKSTSISSFVLLMREHGDKRPDEVVKKEIYEKNIKPFYNTLCVFDDRNKVVDMWRSLGLLCCQVQEGNY